MIGRWLLLTACGGTPEPPPVTQPHVIVVTLDTTRADALGSYGAAADPTPVFDALAAEGTRFDWALSHVPSTLSSHASMFTGLDPHGHGVPRNGYPLDPAHDTLAERLQAVGYHTRAVIAASVLDASMGLDAGFDAYDDALSLHQRIRYEDRGDAVTARALASADARDPAKPLHLWVHYFDAHHPYEAPPDVAARFVPPDHTPPWLTSDELDAGAAFRAGLANDADMAWLRSTYQAEVAWQDHQLGRLLDGLRARGLLDNAVVAIAGDHGEMFGEEPRRPMGHSYDIDLVITRVPLLIWRPGREIGRGRVVSQAVALSDLGPTLLAAAEVPGRLGTGRDLGPLTRGEPLAPKPVFLEATRGRHPMDDDAWNNLANERGVVVRDQVFLRRSTGPDRAYQLDADQSPLTLDAEDMLALAQVLEDWDRRSPRRRPPIEDAPLRAALEALGYIDDEGAE